MNFQSRIVLLVICLFVGYLVYTANNKDSEPTTLGASRSDQIEEALNLLNGYKNIAKGSMDPSRLRASLMKRAKDTERDLDIRLVTSSIFSEGPKLLQESSILLSVMFISEDDVVNSRIKQVWPIDVCCIVLYSGYLHTPHSLLF